jgi:translation initiation factor 1
MASTQFRPGPARLTELSHWIPIIPRARRLPFSRALQPLRYREKRMSNSKRIPTDGGQSFGHNPFDALSTEGLPPGAESPPPDRSGEDKPKRKDRGRVDIIRQKAGRGGKTVTVVKGFVGIGLPEKEELAKKMQKSCGTGGTVKNGQIEIQGDKRAEVAEILREANFRPVYAGG